MRRGPFKMRLYQYTDVCILSWEMREQVRPQWEMFFIIIINYCVICIIYYYILLLLLNILLLLFIIIIK